MIKPTITCCEKFSELPQEFGCKRLRRQRNTQKLRNKNTRYQKRKYQPKRYEPRRNYQRYGKTPIFRGRRYRPKPYKQPYNPQYRRRYFRKKPYNTTYNEKAYCPEGKKIVLAGYVKIKDKEL